ncbi:hypothetical protein BJ138DRAFT_1186543 [Hygrophoropsis aurantiaca]|uniref:Uncharacterized protein n=1 Tax=Hygrophoropsis aurantiaca TaxID=72124 RepID=A0ACB8ACR3_9AGAM|nr:hypothetical protein BJ138DRAFT_1186543 [Hygrophoropsis aurantiaca]
MSHPDDGLPTVNTSDLKRRIALLEAKNEKLKAKNKTPLISLTDRVEDLIAEHDRRVTLDEDDIKEHSEEENRTYRCFQELLRWIPSVRKLVNTQTDVNELSVAYKKLTTGADGARGDDASQLKKTIPLWLPTEAGRPRIKPRDKTGRGFYHNVTGQLLCPVDYNWDDLETKAHIRNYHPDFLVTASSWPTFLYEKNRYNPENPSDGLFKGTLLVKAFKYIFTSPSSTSESVTLSDDEEPPRKTQKVSRECRTRSNIAALLRMNSVQPRAIAYIAVQVRFALSSCGSWRIIDEDFNYATFYNHIVDYFELPPTPEAKADIDNLLLWWNQNVFGRTNAATYRPQVVDNLSVARSFSQRGRVAVKPPL